jgi:[ribosomal protein S5]-alanine N-acetyltransferase
MAEVLFTLRPWHISDLENLVRNANNKNIAQYMTDQFIHPYTEECGKNFISFATANNGNRIFCIDINGEAVGGIGLHPQSDIMRANTEIGYWLAEQHWNKGVISAAIEQIITIGFEAPEITRIFARCFATNTASQKVLEKNGFVLEGRFEKTILKNSNFEDELIYAVRCEQWLQHK